MKSSVKDGVMTVARIVPDPLYLRVGYFLRMGRPLRMNPPRTFNEKLQWLKLHDRNPLYTRLVDKYEMRGYVRERLGDEFLIPLAGGPWNSFDEIDFDALPERFVLKCTHDSGSVWVVRDRAAFDTSAVKGQIERALSRNYYWRGREWPYKNVRPRIVAEEYVELDSPDCAEYKLFCYGGRVSWVMVCRGRAHDPQGGRTNDGFDADFHPLPVSFTNPRSQTPLVKPAEWGELKRVAEALADGMPQVRVDTYLAAGKIYVGEMTFYHDGGFCRFDPPEWDAKFGEGLDITAGGGR